MNIGIVLKDAGGAVLHAVEAPFKEGETIAQLLQTAVKDTPEIKGVVMQTVALAEAVGTAGATAAAGDGINVAADVATFNAIAALYAYVKGTLVPVAKQIWGDVEADLHPAVATSTPAGAVALPASTGPGLHNVVPA